MDPEIRYTRTSDGLNIAYYALGNGPVLIVPPPSIVHAIEPEWQIPSMRRIAEFSARALTYVRYDPRGAGLSDRYDGPFTIDALARDLAAVADAISPADPVLLYAPGMFGMVGLAFAATQPERVAKLVLWATAATGRQLETEPLRRVRALADVDWELAINANAQAVDSFEDSELARQFGAMMAKSDPRTYARFQDDVRGWDVTAMLGGVQAPTLVMHPRSNKYYPVSNASGLAAGIPGAQLRVLDTASVLAGGRDIGAVAGAFFLGTPVTGEAAAGRTSVILFTDIADSTSLTERMGDAAFRAAERAWDQRVRAAMRDAGGTPVRGKVLGDGVMGVFPSAAQAIDAARRCLDVSTKSELRLHIGLHAGDVIREPGNVYGGAVNIAARICGLSAPGEILVSGTVRDLARTSAGVSFDDRGEQALKGIQEPVRVWAVRGASR